MAVLGAVVGAVAAAYAIPRLTEFGWRNGFTWLGKSVGTWAVIAVVYDILLNPGQEATFDTVDLAVTGGLTLFIRGGLNARGMV